ncbi:MAG: hypothetical protein ACU0CC_21120 [Sagittula sp.]|uniref:hypothetical protein n=1 Tax=Sagittula sp. TaxID=2038081 RepID=UPI0035154243
MRVLFVRHPLPLPLVAGLGIAANTALIRFQGRSCRKRQGPRLLHPFARRDGMTANNGNRGERP